MMFSGAVDRGGRPESNLLRTGSGAPVRPAPSNRSPPLGSITAGSIHPAEAGGPSGRVVEPDGPGGQRSGTGEATVPDHDRAGDLDLTNM